MITLKQVDEFMSLYAPKNLSEEWDNDGVMLCKDYNGIVQRAVVSLDVTKQTVLFAVQNKAQLIISHHPLIFRPLKRIKEPDYELFELLIKNNISVFSYHTRLDSAKDGVNDCLAQRLGLNDVAGFGGEHNCIGRIGTLSESMSPDEFGKYLAEKLCCTSVRAALSDRDILKVAVVGGAGKDYVPCAKDADAFVSSEIPHHVFYSAVQDGISIYDCGHYYTENVVVSHLRNVISKQFGELECLYFDTKSPYVCI